MKKFILISSICAAVISSPGFADCTDTLITDSYGYSESLSVQIATLKLIQESHFNEIKKKLNAGATAIVYGMPVKGNSSWSSFKKQRDTYFELNKMDYSKQTAVAISRTHLSNNSLEAYKTCVELESRNKGSLLLTFDEFDDQYAMVTVSWFPTPIPSEEPQLEVVFLSGTTNSKDEVQATLDDYKYNTEMPLQLSRIEGKSLRLTIKNSSGFQKLHLPYVPKIDMCEVDVLMGMNSPSPFETYEKMGPNQTVKFYDGPGVQKRGHSEAYCITNSECKIQAKRNYYPSNGQPLIQAVSPFTESIAEALTIKIEDAAYYAACTILK